MRSGRCEVRGAVWGLCPSRHYIGQVARPLNGNRRLPSFAPGVTALEDAGNERDTSQDRGTQLLPVALVETKRSKHHGLVPPVIVVRIEAVRHKLVLVSNGFLAAR